jgi:DNA-binding NarL/FixJ family response regulator
VIAVLLINEIQLMNNVIAATLEDEADIQIVGSATAVEEALALAPHCDVALISTRLPDNGAVALIRTLTEKHPQVKALALGLAESEEEILQYVEAGAQGYVLRDDSVSELLRSIRAAYNDEALISPEIASTLMSRVSELAQRFAGTAVAPEVVELTPREKDVLKLVSQELTNQEIADELVIEVGTVKNHVHSILQKLNVTSRQDAAAYWEIVADDNSD